MKYSIIIPCYTESESDLRRCFDSVKALNAYEVIVVDDCSPVDTPRIAMEYGFTYIRHAYNKNNGGARNTGIRMATGDYVMFVNADDYVLPETLTLVDAANNGEDLIIIGLKSFGNCEFEFIPDKENTPNTSKIGMNGEPMHICKREFLIKNNLFEMENVAFADVDWVKRLEACVNTYTYVPKALYMFQTGNSNSLTTRILNGEIDGFTRY